jgi:transposase
MNRDHFWLTDAQFARMAPHLPTDTRGKPRVDDRRVISGIVHVLKSGGRWIDAPPDYGPRTTLYNRYVRWAAKGVWIDLFHALASAGGPPAQVLIDPSAVKAHRLASGGKGGAEPGHRPVARRTTKIHALTDRDCRPIAFPLTGGQVADCTAGSALLKQMPAAFRTATRGMTATPSAGRSRRTARCRTSRRRRTAAGRTAFHRRSTATETPSSACSAASRTSGAGPRHPTASPSTFSPPSASRRPSATGYQSEP